MDKVFCKFEVILHLSKVHRSHYAAVALNVKNPTFMSLCSGVDLQGGSHTSQAASQNLQVKITSAKTAVFNA